jgi:hypothetical protein
VPDTAPSPSAGWLRLQAGGHRVAIDPAIGNLRDLSFGFGNRLLSPLHTAPWVYEFDVPASLSPAERHLAGDFFCAPFGASDVEPAPAHGWTANSSWSLVARSDEALTLRLDRPVIGAVIEKTLRLSANAPLLYQVHEISGGSGGLPVAHHPMVRMAATGRLDLSAKRLALTPDQPLEPGQNCLACPGRSASLERFPTAEGGTVDLHRFPLTPRDEDFVTLVEAKDRGLGWTAVIREAEDDIVFLLKDPKALPVTFLWFSNGGRVDPPWNGRHRGVLGIEDGLAAGPGGHRAALTPSALSRLGVPTALQLERDRRHRIAHVIGAIPRPPGWARVQEIEVVGDTLTLTSGSGDTTAMPFDAGFFYGAEVWP